LLFRETVQEVEVVGRVADFCPVCRDLRPFTFRKELTVRVQITIHYVPHVSELESKEAGWDRVCETCNVDLPAFPSTYSSISSDRSLGLEGLIRDTYPELRNKVATRLALEEEVRRGALAPERRRELLLEPFYLLEHRIRSARGKPMSSLRRWSVPTAGALAILGVFGTALLPLEMRANAWPICVMILLASIFVLLRRGILVLNRRSVISRVLRLEIHPQLGRALKPLNPSADELSGLLQELRTQKTEIGSLAGPEAIRSEMECIK
jgi:hypothetical protein